MNEGRMYSHLLVGIFCRVQRKFIHFHLNLQLCETVVEWVLTCRGFCPEIATGCAMAEGEEGVVMSRGFRGLFAWIRLCIFPVFAIGSISNNLTI